MPDEVKPDQIKRQLERMTKSPDFNAGPRAKRLLAYIVNEELDGRGDLIKGTTLAIDVFGRGSDFDSNTDPVVRIEAVKLRKAISTYYRTGGVDDEIEISIPKGRYRPSFKHGPPTQSSPPEIPSQGLPSIHVQPFGGSEGEMAMQFRQALPEDIALELTRFGHIEIVSDWDQEKDGGSENPLEGSHYALAGNVRESAGHLRISVTLSRLPGRTVIWSERFSANLLDGDPFSDLETIAQTCAIRLLGAYGVVAEDVTTHLSEHAQSNTDVYEAVLALHAQLRTSRRESYRSFETIASDALRENPNSGLAHALVVIGMLDAFSMGNRGADGLISVGRPLAERAIVLAPNCQEALFAAAVIARLQGDEERFNHLIRSALAANPNGTLMIALIGAWLLRLGEVETGMRLLDEACEKNPSLPIWTRVSRTMGPIMSGEYESASDTVRNLDARDSLYDWMLITASHGLAGRGKEAGAALKAFKDAEVDPLEFLASFPMHEKLAQRLQTGLTRATA
ncbi:TolB-like protein [Aliiruegeria haliotis]|uniref:TolB-like protein n=1 Tax=Aliiruegeria haliotis TaxID=1280846 RepID=A0A2T0S0I1_9RHOB|nr:hypothetical protein [Aliiruegeria haliotis]PRY26941.1 TolB-like protein [Aliiruegeria haliotis]